MRLLVCCFLITLFGATAYAGDATFDRQLASHVSVHSSAFPDKLTGRAIEISVEISVDREGKLLDLRLVKGTGSKDDDESALAALRYIQPYPHVPDNLETPYKFSAIFMFGSPSRIGQVDLRWPYANAITGSQALYMGQVQSHLRDHPLILSQERSEHGSVQSTLAFTIDRNGTVLEAVLVKRSGIKAIDEEALAWLKRIQPFPKVPSELTTPIKLTADVVFSPKSIENDEEARRKVNGVCRGC